MHRHSRTLSSAIAAIAIAVALLVGPAPALALNARLSWSPVASASGYRIYVRPSSGVYGTGVDVGSQNAASDGAVHFTVANVSVGAMLAVSSYDNSGLESARSNELALSAPTATATATVMPTPVRTSTAAATTTVTATARATVTATRTAMPTVIATITVTPTVTSTPTVTPTPLPTATSAASTGTAVATTTPVRTAVATTAPVTATPTTLATPAAPLADLSTLGTIIARVTAPTGSGNRDIGVIRDGDQPPVGNTQSSRQYDTFDGSNFATEDWIGYAFSTPQRFQQLLFQEGRHFWNGGWFASVRIQVLQSGVWVDVNAAPVPFYGGANAVSYETFRWSFAPVTGDAIRIYGAPGGQDAFISVGELRVFGDAASAPPPTTTAADVTAQGAIVARVLTPTGSGSRNLEVIRDRDMPPVGNTDATRQYDTFDGANSATEDWIGYTYQAPLRFRQVVFQEGRHFWDGGWFETLTLQVRVNGVWTPVSGSAITPAYPGVNARTYETFTFDFPPVTGDGIRIDGRPGGSNAFISVGELRVFADTNAATAAATTVPTSASAPMPDPSASVPASTETAAPIVDTATDDPTPSPACGDGQRDGSESCDGVDDAACSGRCRTDCTCGVVVELPLEGWSAPDDDATGVIVDDAVTREPVLAVSGAAPTSGLEYPATPTLDLALPQLAFTARASAPFTFVVVARSASGETHELAYRAAGAASGATVVIEDARATFAIGDVMAGGELGTTYRDLGADLRAAFAAAFAAVVQVRVEGSLDLARVALASDRARDEDTSARIALPLVGWGQLGAGSVVENALDETLPGLTMRAVPGARTTSRLQLEYPPAETAVFPFATLAFAVRDVAGLIVEVSAVTAAGDDVELTYELGRTAAQCRLRRATLPLATAARATGPWSDVHLDLASDVAALDPRTSLAAVTAVRLRGGFTAGAVQLRDPIDATMAR